MVFRTDNFLLGADDFNWEDDMEHVMKDTVNGASQEMTLEKWVNQLPKYHRAHKEYNALTNTNTELLAALKVMVEYFDPGIPRDPQHPINQAKAAIAKHSGRREQKEQTKMAASMANRQKPPLDVFKDAGIPIIEERCDDNG